jgi:hypothetical protein
MLNSHTESDINSHTDSDYKTDDDSSSDSYSDDDTYDLTETIYNRLDEIRDEVNGKKKFKIDNSPPPVFNNPPIQPSLLPLPPPPVLPSTTVSQIPHLGPPLLPNFIAVRLPHPPPPAQKSAPKPKSIFMVH